MDMTSQKPLQGTELEFARDCCTLSNYDSEDLPEAELAGIIDRYWERLEERRGPEQLESLQSLKRTEIQKSTFLSPAEKRQQLGRLGATVKAEYRKRNESFRAEVDIHGRLNAIGAFMRKHILPRCEPSPVGFEIVTPAGGSHTVRIFPKDGALGRIVFLGAGRGGRDAVQGDGEVPILPFTFEDERPGSNGLPAYTLDSDLPALAIRHLFLAAKYWPFRVCRWQRCKVGSKGSSRPTLFVPAKHIGSFSCSPKCRDAYLHWSRSDPDSPEYDAVYVERRQRAAERQRERKKVANAKKRKSKVTNQKKGKEK